MFGIKHVTLNYKQCWMFTLNVKNYLALEF